ACIRMSVPPSLSCHARVLPRIPLSYWHQQMCIWISLLLRIVRREGRTAGFADSVQFHDLSPRAVRIEKVELPLGITTYLRSVGLTHQPIPVPEPRVSVGGAAN